MAPSAYLADKSEADVRAAERVLAWGTWAITAGAILFSVLTVTPLVQSVTPEAWQWTAPILPIVVDAAVVIVIQLDSVISRLGGSGGPWPALLRWMTGLMTLLLNVGNSALHQDWVGVAVHSVAPLLLIVTAEAGLAYRRAISAALAQIESEKAAANAQREKEREAAAERREEKQRREREARETAAREQRDHAERVERERAEREEVRLREEREHQLALEKERSERETAERKEAAEREENRIRQQREHELRAERERAERQAAAVKEQADREERDRIRVEAERRRQEERQEKERRAAATALPTRVSAAVKSSGSAVSARLPRPARAVEAVVMDDEFSGMTQSEAELALFALYRAARDECVVDAWEDTPPFLPGGEFCGSNLGRRLGRTDAAGRKNVKPKFERWYAEHSTSDTHEQMKEEVLVGVG
ncbi:DUF2637 domain-containing protein [Streptomyces rubiginosohelvolus]|uniref:DUF2637 domain-containing protein n=1 Tax=Streptomyces rubiginosohelvolus TaxID=67362 RepID=UPI003648AA56